MYHWRTDGGAEVDIVLERDGLLFPVEVKFATTVSGHDTRGLRAFRDTYGAEKVQKGVIIYAGKEVRPISDLAVAVPWTAV